MLSELSSETLQLCLKQHSLFRLINGASLVKMLECWRLGTQHAPALHQHEQQVMQTAAQLLQVSFKLSLACIIPLCLCAAVLLTAYFLTCVDAYADSPSASHRQQHGTPRHHEQQHHVA